MIASTYAGIPTMPSRCIACLMVDYHPEALQTRVRFLANAFDRFFFFSGVPSLKDLPLGRLPTESGSPVLLLGPQNCIPMVFFGESIP